VNCDNILNETNSKWNETIANSEIINGTCLEGYDGSVSRSCVLINSTSNWGPISGSCQGFFFFFDFFFSNFNYCNKFLDVDECSTNNGGCDVNAKCENNPGSFSCSCQQDYSGDGFHCTKTNISSCMIFFCSHSPFSFHFFFLLFFLSLLAIKKLI